MLIGRNAVAENAERRHPAAFGHVAQYLVIGAVFFDDIDHVLEHRRFADALRYGLRLDAGTR